MYADGEIGMDEEPGLFDRFSSYIAGLFSGDEGGEDLVLAHAWASIAIANESIEADELLANLEGRMSEGQLTRARRQFAQWQIQ